MSDLPTRLFDGMSKSLEGQIAVVSGGAGDGRYRPDEVLGDAAKASAAAAAALDEVLNEPEGNLARTWEGFKVANSACAVARDHLAVSGERVAAVAAHLNELELDKAGRLASRIPGYPQEEA